MMLAVYALWHRELVRFLGDRSRVFSSVGQPVVFWFLFAGALSRSSFRPNGLGYGEYFWVGGLAMTLLFTAIFSTITVIEDRKEGFLQGVLIAPVPRLAVVLGKILGGATLAMLHGILFFALLPVVGFLPGLPAVLVCVTVMAVLAIAVTGMGYSLAWLMDSSAGYHGIMMLLFMPMLLLSGAFFPVQDAHPVVSFVMRCNPLTYGMAALRHSLYPAGSESLVGLPSFGISIAVTALFAVTMVSLGTLITLRRTARDVI